MACIATKCREKHATCTYLRVCGYFSAEFSGKFEPDRINWGDLGGAQAAPHPIFFSPGTLAAFKIIFSRNFFTAQTPTQNILSFSVLRLAICRRVNQKDGQGSAC